jgi:hypothetical protein
LLFIYFFIHLFIYSFIYLFIYLFILIIWPPPPVAKAGHQQHNESGNSSCYCFRYDATSFQNACNSTAWSASRALEVGAAIDQYKIKGLHERAERLSAFGTSSLSAAVSWTCVSREEVPKADILSARSCSPLILYWSMAAPTSSAREALHAVELRAFWKEVA